MPPEYGLQEMYRKMEKLSLQICSLDRLELSEQVSAFQLTAVHVMCRSIRKLNIPPRATPRATPRAFDWLVQIPSPRGETAVQMPHQLVLNYLSSKTNFVFNQDDSNQ